MKIYRYLLLFKMVVILSSFVYSRESYQNFNVAVYARVYDVVKMKDLNWLEQHFNVLAQSVKIDKVYLETHRDMVLAEKETIQKAKKFFQDRGIQTAGGITLTVNESNWFQTFCYTNPEHRKRIKEIVEFTAGLFDEVILDDFFFTNCKCESCIKAKGKQSWTEFRLDLMEKASRELIIEPAKKVNPKVEMVIKYPNWYDHYQCLGYNLESEPQLFDRIYTGTETRDPVYSHQHLQPYQSYLIMRYLENVKPNYNGGGWVDPFGRRFLDRYGEQLWMTLFAKAKEITLFSFGHVLESIQLQENTFKPASMVIPLAGAVFEQVDSFLGQLGEPVGVKSYKPTHSSGEDFLHNYIGMLGIPIEIVPEFSQESEIIFLTESAKIDQKIVEKIKKQLMDGKTVVITSGLLAALQEKGIEDIVELEYTNKKALVRKFRQHSDIYLTEKDICIPQIRYATNDSWEIITCLSSGIGYPIFHKADYANGALYVFVIPDNFGDLYYLPVEVLTVLKQIMMKDIYVHVESSSQVCLFVYDNHHFIVESFLPYRASVTIVLDKEIKNLIDLHTGHAISGEIRGENRIFQIQLNPYTYRVFQCTTHG